MPSVTLRILITSKTLQDAVKFSRESTNSDFIRDWFDERQHYLQLRQRGRSVSWFVRARGQSRKIGIAYKLRPSDRVPNFLSISEARNLAAITYASLEKSDVLPSGKDVEMTATWTWGDLDREYQVSLKGTRWIGGANGREKPPSLGTQDDVRRALSRAPLVALQSTPLLSLKRLTLDQALREIHAAFGHKACFKSCAYFKAAMTWAQKKRASESGLLEIEPWWRLLTPPDPYPEEIKRNRVRRIALAEAKVRCKIEDVAELLVRHERFCAGRSGRDLITPGVRWGLWWVALTTNRRFSTFWLERSNLIQEDRFGNKGWGRASWSIEVMKGRTEFWLPLPPVVLRVANSAIADWERQVNGQKSYKRESRWVFSSTRRIPRKGCEKWVQEEDGSEHVDLDIKTYPNSLNGHLRSMRGLKGKSSINYLEGLPNFTPHLVRAICGNFLNEHTEVPKSSISAMLAHKDNSDTNDKLAATTENYYVQNQKMRLKAQAMQAWSGALIAEYVRRGGKLNFSNDRG